MDKNISSATEGAWIRKRVAKSARAFGLTPRQSEVVQWLACDDPRKSIAARLGLSLHTIDFHVWRVCESLGVNTPCGMMAKLLCWAK